MYTKQGRELGSAEWEVQINSENDIPALLAEVERLQKESSARYNAIEKLVKQNKRIISRNVDENLQISTLKKKLEDITRTKNDYFRQMQSYIRAFRLHQSALELACKYSALDGECPFSMFSEQIKPECESEICGNCELSECWYDYFIQQAQAQEEKK